MLRGLKKNSSTCYYSGNRNSRRELDHLKIFYRKSRTTEKKITFIPPDTNVCTDCLREFFDPSDRRFHTQPTSCPVCGPKLFYIKTIKP